MKRLLFCSIFLVLAGCATTSSGPSNNSALDTPPVASSYVGRRLFSDKFMYWGYVKPEGSSWGKNSTRLVIFQENVPAPDRAEGPRGRDDNFEYRLKGYFSGKKAYEPKTDYLLDVFVLDGYEVLSANNPPFTTFIPIRTPGGYITKPRGTSVSSKPRGTLEQE
mgnify:CR=1 FL=1